MQTLPTSRRISGTRGTGSSVTVAVGGPVLLPGAPPQSDGPAAQLPSSRPRLRLVRPFRSQPPSLSDSSACPVFPARSPLCPVPSVGVLTDTGHFEL